MKLQKIAPKLKRKNNSLDIAHEKNWTKKFIKFKSGTRKLLIRTGECNQCGECCKTLNITVVRDVTLNQHKSIKELELYLSYRGICLVGEDIKHNQLFYSINIPCQQLGPENACKVHEDPEAKPLLCHRYPIEPDNSEDCSYQFHPSTPLRSVEFDIARTR